MTIEQTLKRDLLNNTAPGAVDSDRKLTPPETSADIDQHLVASSKQVLLKSIDFQPAEQDVSFHLQNLRVKYVALNASQSSSEEESKGVCSSNHSQMNGQVDVRQDGIPAPKKVLYPSDKITLAWQRCQRIGPGLVNMGNTCFLNATLQCLTYTPPLTNYLLSHQHKTECREPGFCVMCELCNHVHRTFNHQQNGQAIRPMVLLHKLKHFAKHLHIGRQEDAHEFLRLLIEAMQKSCIYGLEKLDKYTKETSLVYQIFSGYYRSRVICSICQTKSDTFDPFLDIGLDIKQAPSITRALERLIRPEALEGENLYQCKKCNRKVPAQKRFTIQRAPTVLTLCLKRFDFNRFSMGKINKEVGYSDHLNIRPYMSDPKGPPIMYELYGVLKHEGVSCNSGHYYCFVKAANQSWYCMNDAFVSQVSLQRVLNQNAYLLFYIRRSNFKSPMNGAESKRDVHQPQSSKPVTPISKPQSLFNGPVGMPVPRPSPTATQAGHPQNPASKLVTCENKQRSPLEASKQPPSSQQKQDHQQQQKSMHNTPKIVPLPLKRENISFSLRTKAPTTSISHNQQPLLACKTPAPVSTESSPLKSPTVTGAGDASKPTQPKHVPAKSAFSPQRPLKTQPSLLTSSKIPSKESLKDLVKPKVKPTQDASNLNGVCKAASGSVLVPYSTEDSNSSPSDSDTDYDKVAAELSTPAGSNQVSNSKTPEKPQVTSQEPKEDPLPSSSKVKENNVETMSMKPPAAAKSIPADGLQLSPTQPKKGGLANNTNLTAIRKPESPLKLTITTNGQQAQRIKSTAPWRVVDSDSQVSPSPASDCSLHSNVSTNSTSEWSTLDKKDAPQTPDELKKEASVFGWNVTPSKLKNLEKVLSEGEEHRTPVIKPKTLKFHTAQDQTPQERSSIEDRSQSRPKTEPSLKNSSTINNSRTCNEPVHTDATTNPKSTINGDQLDQLEIKSEPDPNCNVAGNSESREKSREKDSREDREEGTYLKKKRKREILPNPTDTDLPRPSNFKPSSGNNGNEPTIGDATSEEKPAETANDFDSLIETTRKHKKKKKRKEKEKVDRDDVEMEEEWVERVIKPQQSSDQEPLLSDVKPDKDKHARHKHKSSSRSSDYSEEELDSKISSKSHKIKRRDKFSMLRRSIEEKVKRYRDRHSKQKYKHLSPNCDESPQDTYTDGYHKLKSGHKRDHGDHKRSKPERSRVRHSSDAPSDSNYSATDRLFEEDSHGKRKKHRDSERHKHGSDSVSNLRHSKTESEHSHRDSSNDYSKTSVVSERINGDEHHHRRDKKKKRKHQDEDREHTSHLSTAKDDDYRPEKKKKKCRSLERENEIDKNDEVTSKKSRHEAPVQQWDHHIQDNYRRHSDDSSKPSTHTSWDGTRGSSTAIDELSKSSLRAYGPTIQSWEGSRSALDDEVEHDARMERQRDPYEEDFDRGKVKKGEKHREDNRHKIFGSCHNPFQVVQNMRNKNVHEKDHHSYNRFSHHSHSERPR